MKRQTHERTSMKEHLVRHDSKHKIQVHTIKRNKQQHKQKQNRTHFQNKNNEKPEKRRPLTKTKARGKMNIDGYSKHTHSLTHIHRHTRTHPHTHTHTPSHTQDLGEKRGKEGFDRHIFYKTGDYNNNRKWKDGKNMLSLYVYLTSEFTHNKFQKVC